MAALGNHIKLTSKPPVNTHMKDNESERERVRESQETSCTFLQEKIQPGPGKRRHARTHAGTPARPPRTPAPSTLARSHARTLARSQRKVNSQRKVKSQQKVQSQRSSPNKSSTQRKVFEKALLMMNPWKEPEVSVVGLCCSSHCCLCLRTVDVY